ncbi:MAG: ATP-binding protein [Acidobacteria bacterium]|nr:MAG: ATP-binding protein [Acidobacteriota bacterium]
MASAERIRIRTDRDILLARQRGREMGQTAGFVATDLTLIATAISELARNIVLYAREGMLEIHLVAEDARCGLLIVARDHGPGIADLTRAMQDGFSTSGGLGLGLPGVKRLMDSFEIDSYPGLGTTVRIAKWRRS